MPKKLTLRTILPTMQKIIQCLGHVKDGRIKPGENISVQGVREESKRKIVNGTDVWCEESIWIWSSDRLILIVGN